MQALYAAAALAGRLFMHACIEITADHYRSLLPIGVKTYKNFGICLQTLSNSELTLAFNEQRHEMKSSISASV